METQRTHGSIALDVHLPHDTVDVVGIDVGLVFVLLADAEQDHVRDERELAPVVSRVSFALADELQAIGWNSNVFRDELEGIDRSEQIELHVIDGTSVLHNYGNARGRRSRHLNSADGRTIVLFGQYEEK